MSPAVLHALVVVLWPLAAIALAVSWGAPWE